MTCGLPANENQPVGRYDKTTDDELIHEGIS